MSYSKRSRYSGSPSPDPDGRYGRSVYRSRSRSRSRSLSVENPGNNLYVTGLSTRVTKKDLEKHFSNEGKVEDIHLVVDPWTRESRGFGFVTMSTVEEAVHCIKYLNRSVLEGRVIMVEKARRQRGRTPTPGRYLGLRAIRVRRRLPSHSPHHRSRSPRYSSERDRSRSYSPHYSRRRSYSPYYGRRGSYSPRYRRGRSYSRSYSPYSSPYSPRYRWGRSYSRSYSPRGSSPARRDRSYTPYDSRWYSPDDCYHRRSHYRSISQSISPTVRRSRRSYSRSVSPRPRRISRKSNSRGVLPKKLRRSCSRSISPRPSRSYSSSSYSRSGGESPYSRSVSRSVTPRSTSPSP